jgi:two-component system chemotaxis sensor kinase CheA
MNPNFGDMAQTFKEECDELLENMEESLMDIQDNGMNSENINAVFRAAHTIKGSAGMFDVNYLVKFTHTAENLLDDIRNDKTQINDDMISTLLESKDLMDELITYAIDNTDEPDGELSDRSSRLLQDLINHINGTFSSSAPKPAPAQIPVQEPVQTPEVTQTVQESKPKHDEISDQEFEALLKEATQKNRPKGEVQAPSDINGQQFTKIEITFNDNTFESGIEPSDFIDYLDKIGEIKKVEFDSSKIPDFNELSPKDCFLKIKLEIDTKEDEDKIRDIFDIAKEFVELKIEKAKAVSKQDILKSEEPPAKPLPVPAPTKKVVPAKTGEKKTADKKTAVSQSIRVDANKIDQLINQIGEMVIANANVIEKASRVKNSELIESVSIVSRMLENIRESAMKIRMVQIGETFNRFKRIVRDVSKELGKDIDLVIQGAETELDKTVTEKITDPLIHLVRNAVDHGVEAPEDRVLKGKNAKGTLILKAYHDAGNIAIEIVDDGKGLNEEVLLRKGIEKGLVDPNATLSKKDIYGLILQAGFSTAEKITNISGRGVGMDVVKRNIEELRGTIELDSELDIGTTITIRLPLTLAIIDGFLVKVGDGFYVIPLEMIVECIELTDESKKGMHSNNYINLRGNILPLLDLRDFFDEDYETQDKRRDNIVVVQFGNQKIGLLVDELHGEFQTVIKPLGNIFENLKGLSGATILGSGVVAMILDIPMLIQYINQIVNAQFKLDNKIDGKLDSIG